MGNCNCSGHPGIDQRGILREFAQAMTRWKAAGYPLATREFHTARHTVCLLCKERRGFCCGRCGCLVYLKSKLLTEECDRWPKSGS